MSDSSGMICNDPSGLCLAHRGGGNDNSEGSISPMMDPATSGVYTSLTKLASQLQPGATTAPVIAIETSTSTILVKDMHGHAVAIQKPREASTSSSSPSSQPPN
uniref:Late endosomal/lysosomal adaptor and MAPK and MTOR activator 5 n=1 Tax=Grammatophora oceanica TaxID=210454 RepID=A0A7S1VT46_9STRA|mmetsp:Transcript_6562/g.9584  ORF Transcript_6562/g.9584 Transcript_6562/m.9584 type:complete len:104 (+) Transcript_6562:74-385(+)